jgi:hypothetical protein
MPDRCGNLFDTTFRIRCDEAPLTLRHLLVKFGQQMPLRLEDLNRTLIRTDELPIDP